MGITSERRKGMVKEMIKEQIRIATEKAEEYNNAKKAPFEVDTWITRDKENNYKIQMGILIGMKNALKIGGIIEHEEYIRISENINEIIDIAYKTEE